MKDPAFLFYPGDYLRDTQCLSEKTQVAYDRIMCEHMRNICITQQQLNFFTKRLSEDETAELMMILTKIDGGFQIAWVAESIQKRREYSESRRKNRSKKAISPKKDMNNICKTYDEHMENENEIVNENINKEGRESAEREGYVIDILDADIDTVMQHYIETTARSIPMNHYESRALIRAKFDEGHSIEDLQDVIDLKTYEASKGTYQRAWLRPSTLFGPKFIHYLNDVHDAKKGHSISGESRIERQRREAASIDL